MKKYSELEMIDHMKKLFPICRSITGKGARSTLEYFENYHKEYSRITFKTGQKVFDWNIPYEWNINDAYIEHIKSGERFAEFSKNNLHLVGYSEPINKEIEFKDLSKRIFTLKDQPDLIPYITSYYKRNWGFCMSENNKKKMKRGKYRVFIDSKLEKGSLDLSHAILKGQYKEEILFSSYICHPSMANNELSGPIVLNALLDYIKRKYPNNKYTYRFHNATRNYRFNCIFI